MELLRYELYARTVFVCMMCKQCRSKPITVIHSAYIEMHTLHASRTVNQRPRICAISKVEEAHESKRVQE